MNELHVHAGAWARLPSIDGDLELTLRDSAFSQEHVFSNTQCGLAEESVLDVAEAVKGDLRRGAGLVVPRVHKVGEGGAEHAAGDVQPVAEVLQPVLPLLGGLGGNDTEDVEGRFSGGQVAAAFIDQPPRKR